MTSTEQFNALLGASRQASIVIANLSELPGYNGSILTIDDTEAEHIAADLDALNDAVAALLAERDAMREALADLLDAHAVPSSACAERPAYEKARLALQQGEQQ